MRIKNFLFSFALGLLAFININALAQEEFDAIEDTYFYENHLYFNVESGWMRFRAPKYSYGFFSLTPFTSVAGELPIFTVRDNPEAPYVKLLVGYQFQNLPSWIGSGLALEGYYSIFMSDSKIRPFGPLVTPLGTVGIFPFLDNPIAFSFLSIGSPAFIGDLTRSYHYSAGGLKLKSLYLLPTALSINLEPYIDFGVNEFDQHYELNMLVSGSGLDGPFDLRETLKATFYDLGFGINVDTFFTRWFGAFIEGGVYASLAHSRLTAHQNGLATVTFPSVVEKHVVKSTWSSKFKGSAGLSFAVRKWTLSLVGNYEYWGFMPRLENPNAFPSPLSGFLTNGRVDIANSSSHNYSFGIKISTPL